MKRFLIILMTICIMMTICLPKDAYAAENGYDLRIDDQADLFTDEEEAALLEFMESVRAYGNVVLVTVDENISTPEEFCHAYFGEFYGTSDSVMLLIDMDNRVIRIQSDGKIYDVIDENYADTITDNIYKYASQGNYYGCAKEAFTEIFKLLSGFRIAQPMKYITNGLLALIIAAFSMFLYVNTLVTRKAPSTDEMLKYLDYEVKIVKMRRVLVNKRRNSTSSGGSGHSHHSSGGSSRSSGGHSSSQRSGSGNSSRSSGGYSSSHRSGSGGSTRSSGGYSSSHRSSGGGSSRSSGGHSSSHRSGGGGQHKF